jgi:hypothetical protein
MGSKGEVDATLFIAVCAINTGARACFGTIFERLDMTAALGQRVVGWLNPQTAKYARCSWLDVFYCK